MSTMKNIYITTQHHGDNMCDLGEEKKSSTIGNEISAAKPIEITIFDNSVTGWRTSTSNLTKTKKFMQDMGFIQNIDYKIIASKHTIKVQLAAHKAYLACWIILNLGKINES